MMTTLTPARSEKSPPVPRAACAQGEEAASPGTPASTTRRPPPSPLPHLDGHGGRDEHSCDGEVQGERSRTRGCGSRLLGCCGGHAAWTYGATCTHPQRRGGGAEDAPDRYAKKPGPYTLWPAPMSAWPMRMPASPPAEDTPLLLLLLLLLLAPQAVHP